MCLFFRLSLEDFFVWKRFQCASLKYPYNPFDGVDVAEFAAAGHTHLVTAHPKNVDDAYETIAEVEGYVGSVDRYGRRCGRPGGWKRSSGLCSARTSDMQQLRKKKLKTKTFRE